MTAKANPTTIGLQFLSNEANEDEGLGDAGIETYRDEPYAGTAREIGQNSRDAFTALPVRISFDVVDVPFDQIPNLDKLKSTVDACLKKAHAANDEKEIAFFEQAYRVLEKGPLKVLAISDSNTTGLTGPDVSGTAFHSLVKSSGVSKKASNTSGGSFGIGKNAAFAISDLQTVFYSTIYAENGKPHFLAQGKSILVSHVDDAGVPKGAVGYWGLPGYHPVSDSSTVPGWLKRDHQGTTVLAVGFRDTPDWQHRIACSLLQNFFYAIHTGEMEFAIDHGRIVISKLTLGALFHNPDLKNAAKANDRSDGFELSQQIFTCLTSAGAVENDLNVPGLGTVRIRVLTADKLPKKVCIIRNGMVITDSLEYFGEKFARFPMYRDFVALVVPLDDEGRAFIKKLENPKHDGLSADRLPSLESRAHAKSVMKKFATTIRDTIKSVALTQFADEVSADEMRQYFQADAAKPDDPGESSEDDPETVKYRLEPKKTPVQPRVTGKGEGNIAGRQPKPGLGPEPGPGPRPGPRPRPPWSGIKTTARPIVLSDVRNLLPTAKNPRMRTIMFTPSEGGRATIVLEASGLNESEDMKVLKATGAEANGGKLIRQLIANERTRIDIEFDEPYAGPIELSANIEPEGAADENQ